MGQLLPGQRGAARGTQREEYVASKFVKEAHANLRSTCSKMCCRQLLLELHRAKQCEQRLVLPCLACELWSPWPAHTDCRMSRLLVSALLMDRYVSIARA